MPSDFVLKAMNAAHRIVLKLSGNRVGASFGGMPSLELTTVGQLLRHYPRKYDRRGKLTDLSSLKVGERVTVWARVKSVKERQLGPGRKVRTITNVVIEDSATQLSCTFFNRWNLARLLPVGTEAMFSGTVSSFNQQLQITR